MSDLDGGEARRAVELLAASVGPPPPPERLRIGSGARRSGWVGVAVILAAGAVALWMLPVSEKAPVKVVPASRVVVEHLRVQGRTVPTEVKELPGTGAVVILVLEQDEAPPDAPDEESTSNPAEAPGRS